MMICYVLSICTDMRSARQWGDIIGQLMKSRAPVQVILTTNKAHFEVQGKFSC